MVDLEAGQLDWGGQKQRRSHLISSACLLSLGGPLIV